LEIYFAPRLPPLVTLTRARAAGAKGALVACFSVYDDFQPFFAGNPLGIYRKSAQSKSLGGHCICVIGYNDEDGGYWVCKNSWSHLWADHGFFKIGYGEVGIDAYMWSLDFGI
jgi:C1A family cysteine protease